MIANADLPHVLAVINLATVATLTSGYVCIRRKEKAAHKACMVISVLLGVAFLAIYLTYHFNAGLAKFGGHGLIRPIYFGILIVHLSFALVAAVIVPFAVARAWRGNFEFHRRVAKWALPIWLFVSVSGLVVYVMTMHLFPFDGAVS